MSFKKLVRAGLVLLAVVSSVAVSVQSVVSVPGMAVLLAGDDEPTRPTKG